jgi:hypothetical protein
MTDAPARAYAVDLLCPSAPTIEKPKLLEQLSRYCPDAVALQANPAPAVLTLAHPKHPVKLGNALIPAQTMVALAEKAIPAEVFEGALQQTWEFPEARTRVQSCSSAVLVSDLMASSLPHRERLDLFESCLRAVLDCVPCAAIHWRPSGRIVDPAAWRREFDAGDAASRFFAGAINVRMFKPHGEGAVNTGELVMDTLGLSALGLPDVQCHFHGLDPSPVARVLYNTAWYLCCEGDVIADGHTLEGVGASKWRCEHQRSIAGPERLVLDLNPGPEHTPGKPAH